MRRGEDAARYSRSIYYRQQQRENEMKRAKSQYIRNGVSSPKSAKVPSAVHASIVRGSVDSRPASSIYSIIRPTSARDQCLICWQKILLEEMQTLECGHRFCNECLYNYLIYKIQVMEEIECAAEECRAVIPTSNHCFAFLSQRHREQYDRFQLWKQTMNNPRKKLCPSEKCKGIINLDQNVFKCDTCMTEYCSECMLRRHEGPCDMNFQQNFKSWKRCPSCQMFIDRNEGCNHMTCRCGNQFCYVCLSQWSDLHYACLSDIDPLLNGIFYRDSVRQATVFKNAASGIILCLFLPLLVTLLIFVLIMSLVVGMIGGFMCGPCIASNQLPLPQVLVVLCCPIVSLCSGAVTAGDLFCNATNLTGEILERYIRTIRAMMLYRRPENDAQEGPDIEILEEDNYL